MSMGIFLFGLLSIGLFGIYAIIFTFIWIKKAIKQEKPVLTEYNGEDLNDE